MKIADSTTSLSFDASCPGNSRKYPHKPYNYCQKLESLGYIFGLSSFIFSSWAPKKHFETECIMAAQGHPKSLILAPRCTLHVGNFLLVMNSNIAWSYLAPFLRYSNLLAEKTPILPTLLSFNALARVNCFEFPDEVHNAKTSVLGLSDCEDFVILACVVLTQCQRGRTTYRHTSRP